MVKNTEKSAFGKQEKYLAFFLTTFLYIRSITDKRT